jgi:hypothetical protein
MEYFFCKEIGFTRIVLEGDTLQIVREINSESPQLSRYGHPVDDIRKILSSLCYFQVVHIKKNANEAAHDLAKETIPCHRFNLVRRYSPNNL